MDFSFRRPVYPGDAITCELFVESIDDSGFARAHALLTNPHGVEVMTAILEGYLPDVAARDRLGRMMEEGDPTNPLRGERS
jgi:hypothetical protein